MVSDPVITVDEFKTAREMADSQWSDYEVFDEERDEAPLREVVTVVVEGQYTHPSGPDSVYGMVSSAGEYALERVRYEGLVPEGVPDDVRERFAEEFADEVQEYAEVLYKDVRDELDEDDDLSEVQYVLESHAVEVVPDGF